MNSEKYNRRVRSVQWAQGYRERARTEHRALRAAELITALENWLKDNSPMSLTGYKD